MQAYYGSKISPHMTKTDEGYLICHDVPINRVGMQEYAGDELGMGDNNLHKVLRRPEEVFDKAALASFEGKPVTDGHPPEVINAENIQIYEKGHAQNVRRGVGADSGTTIADLFITDPQLIHEIENGKREISCGYTYDLLPHENGIFEQRRIRGNHIAVVDAGRAGHRVAIKDEKPEKSIERGNTMPNNKKGFWGRIIRSLAKDESISPEELEEVSKKAKEPEDTDEIPADKKPEQVSQEKEPENEPEKKPEVQPKKEPETNDEAPDTAVLLQKVIELLDGLKAELAPKESGDDLDNLIKPKDNKKEEEEDESPEEQEPEVTLPAEKIPEKPVKAKDEMSTTAAITQEVLRKAIKDPHTYKMAAKDAADAIRNAYGVPRDNSGYMAFVRTTADAARKRTANSYINEHNIVNAQSAYDKLNPHVRKEDK